MFTVFPILAAILQASSFTLDKVVLSMRRVGYQMYTGVSFPLSFLAVLGIYLIFRPPITADLFEGKIFLFLLVAIAGAIVSNVIFYRALDHDRLSEIESLGLIRFIPVIVVSGIIFADERNFALLIPALVASAAVIWSHWERHHIHIAKDTWPFLMWSIIFAPVGAALSKVLLETWNPISLELVRTGVAAIIFIVLFRRAIKRVPFRAFLFLIVTNVLTSTAWILFYFGYQRLGIVHTMLLFSLQPLLVYFSGVLFLKESFEMKKFTGFLIVLAAIIAGQIMS